MRLDAPRARALAPSLRLPRVGLSSRAIARLTFGAIGCAAFALYLTTLAPTVMWYDMGEFATASASLGIAHNTGYPLLILLGKLFTFLPVGDTAYRVNLMSAVFTALAIAIVAAIIHDLTDDLIAAAIGAATLAASSTVWAEATWSTSYGLNLFFTAIVVRCMLSWWRDRAPRSLMFAALAFGLGMCNHRLIVLVAPPSLLLLALGWRSLDRRTLLFAAAAFVAGLSVYLYLPIRGAQEPVLSWARPANWHTYWSMFLTGQTPSGYWRIELADRIDVLWSYPSYDLTWAGLALAGVGAAVVAARTRAVAAFFAVIIVLDAIVVETYSIHNIYNYLTPAYLVLCVLIGVAAAWLGETVRRASVARTRSLTAARAASVRPWMRVAALGVCLALLPASLAMKNYDRVDRSGDYAAHDFALTTLANLPDRAVILTDSWAASPLWYAQIVEGQRHDVLVSPIFSVQGEDVPAFSAAQMAAGRPVYVAEGLRTPLADLAARYTLQPVLLDGIEEMIANTLPQPRYRDDLVTTGSLYKLLEKAPDLHVDAVSAGAALDLRFDDGVSLVGFEASSAVVDRGDVVQLSYYWRADHALDRDLSAVTLYYDADGTAATHDGFPRWSQTRVIDGGLLETSKWEAGSVVNETYFTLVPRTIAAGTYEVRIATFDPADAASTHAASSHLVTVAKLIVR